ncbi:MAG: hypothetical protein RL885_18500 [Planctomycetota bacterium]
MLPRRIVPGQVWFVTRRCFQGRCLLRPDPEVSQIVSYVMAVAAKLSGVRILAVIQMSNHWHLLVEDVEGRLPEFLQRAHWLITMAVNRFRHRYDSLFEAGATHCQPVETLEDALRIASYIEANPVKDDLVDKAKEWPGLSSVLLEPEQVVSIPRPEIYFDEKGDMPDFAELCLAPIPAFGTGYNGLQINKLVRARVREREKVAREARRKARRTVMGVKRVLATDPEDGPDERPKPKPILWSCIPEVAKRIQEREDAFQDAYSEALPLWRRDKSVRMPYGTYWLRRFAGALTEEPPPDAEAA